MVKAKRDMKSNNITYKDWLVTVLYILLLIMIITLGAVLLLPKYWVVWIIILVISVLALIKWHTNNFAYQCRNCSDKFAISVWLNLISPHGINREGAWQYLKCPNCHKWTKAKVIKRRNL